MIDDIIGVFTLLVIAAIIYTVVRNGSTSSQVISSIFGGFKGTLQAAEGR